MTTVIRSFATLPMLETIRPTDAKLSQAREIKFYYKGGSDILAIERTSPTAFMANIPDFSSITALKLDEVVRSLENNILDEMSRNKIALKTPFLFDTSSKSIITWKSFMNIIPFYNIKKSIFTVDQDPSKPLKVYHLPDFTGFTEVMFTCLILAKNRLLRSKSGSWTDTGKKLLAFLTSMDYEMAGNFSTDHGHWDLVNYDFSKDKPRNDFLDFKKVKLDRAMELSKKFTGDQIEEDNPFNYLGYCGDGDIDFDKGVLLSDALQFGIENLIKETVDLGKNIEILIDTSGDIFKKISIDIEAELCLVQLQEGVERTQEWLMEALQTEGVVIVTESKSIKI